MSKRKLLKFIMLGVMAGSILVAGITSASASKSGIEQIQWGKSVTEVYERVLKGPYKLPAGWREATRGTKEIEVFNYGALLPWDPATAKAGKKFEKMTGIKVNYLVTPRMQMRPKQVAMLAAKSPSVDVLQCDFSLVYDYQKAGWLEDISFLFPEGTWDYYTPAVADLYQIKGKTWGLPQYGRIELFLWNKKLFLQAGLDPESPPRTWAELYKTCEILKEKLPANIAPFYRAFTGEEFPQLAWTAALYQQQGRLLQPDGTVKYNTPEGIKAEEHWVKMIKDGLMPRAVFEMDEGDVSDSFNAGTVAMVEIMSFAVSRAVEALGKENVGVTTLVKAPGPKGVHAGLLDSDGLFINPFSKRKAAAALYLDYIRSYEHHKDELVVEGNIPHVPSVFDDPEAMEQIPFPKVYKRAVKNGYLEAYPFQQTLYHYHAKYVVAGMKEELSPEEAMDKLQEECNSLFGY